MTDGLESERFAIVRPERDDRPDRLYLSADEEDFKGRGGEHYGALALALVDGHDVVLAVDPQADEVFRRSPPDGCREASGGESGGRVPRGG